MKTWRLGDVRADRPRKAESGGVNSAERRRDDVLARAVGDGWLTREKRLKGF